MKVILRLDVDDQARYVIARYFRPVDDKKTRTRATRKQVKRFAEAALRTSVRELMHDLDGRGKSVAQRLGDPSVEAELLQEPREKQRPLAW